jgi:hypothetical protein
MALVDPRAANPAFADGRPPVEDVQEVIDWTRQRLRLGPDRPWKLISARRKFGKTLFEIEEHGPEGPFRMIAKIGREERMRNTWQALQTLWSAGFCPPAEFTVTKPVAFFPERHLLFQEKAPGSDLLSKIEKHAADGLLATRRAAHWLADLHSSALPCERWQADPAELSKWSSELGSIAPAAAVRIVAIADAARTGLRGHTPDIVPAHGDFHLLNIFIADNGRITAIDLDKFGGRDRAEEVGYALCQTACICFHRVGSFEVSLAARVEFLRAYEEVTGTVINRNAAGAQFAATLIKNLHFDLYACKTGRTELLEPWLSAAERCLRGDIDIS